RRQDSPPGSFQKLVDDDAPVHRQASRLCQGHCGTHADTYHDKVRVQFPAATQGDGLAIDGCNRLAQMEAHALRLVQRLNEAADFEAHDVLEPDLARSHDVDFDLHVPKRRGDLESDEARADDAGPRRLPGAFPTPTPR